MKPSLKQLLLFVRTDKTYYLKRAKKFLNLELSIWSSMETVVRKKKTIIFVEKPCFNQKVTTLLTHHRERLNVVKWNYSNNNAILKNCKISTKKNWSFKWLIVVVLFTLLIHFRKFFVDVLFWLWIVPSILLNMTVGFLANPKSVGGFVIIMIYSLTVKVKFFIIINLLGYC